jgi:hypothetical protein
MGMFSIKIKEWGKASSSTFNFSLVRFCCTCIMDKFLFDRNMEKDTCPQKALGLFNQKGCTVKVVYKGHSRESEMCPL